MSTELHCSGCIGDVSAIALATLVALVNRQFVDSSIDTYEISVISVNAGNTLCARDSKQSIV